MCNLYSVTKGQSAIRDLFSVKYDRAGNLPPLPAIFPASATLAGATSGLMASMRAARRSGTKAAIRARLKDGG